jgi:hypothetical protein
VRGSRAVFEEGVRVPRRIGSGFGFMKWGWAEKKGGV